MSQELIALLQHIVCDLSNALFESAGVLVRLRHLVRQCVPSRLCSPKLEALFHTFTSRLLAWRFSVSVCVCAPVGKELARPDSQRKRREHLVTGTT